MFKKILLASVFIAFVCVQLAATLTCYHCDGVTDCNAATVVTCTNETANATRVNLEKYFVNVSNTTTNNFDCLYMNYTNSLNVTTIETAGCVHREIAACSLTLNSSIAMSLTNQNCTICSGNMCNPPRAGNPAGTYSSSFTTIMITIFMLMGAKIFV